MSKFKDIPLVRCITWCPHCEAGKDVVL